ncbi:hypothetical protein [Mediterraneibacter gnavus]
MEGEERYRKLYDLRLAHIQITITCFDDKRLLNMKSKQSVKAVKGIV